MMVAQAKVAETQAKIQQGAFAPKPEGGLGEPAPQQPTPLELEELRIKQMDAATRAESIGIKHRDALMHDRNRDLDRQSRERLQLLQLAKEILTHPEGVEGAEQGLGKLKKEVRE
jgi:hypothetical protein